MHMSISQKWQVSQIEPFKKPWFVVMNEHHLQILKINVPTSCDPTCLFIYLLKQGNVLVGFNFFFLEKSYASSLIIVY
jgi:hypothetical protein